MMLRTYFRSSRVHMPTLSRAALNYECKVARAHAKVAQAHARVCRGLATPLKYPKMVVESTFSAMLHVNFLVICVKLALSLL